ncbi:hypothetical protein BDZ88DRAFT_427501 [Geranomyces variabilis]|nr:hypothetical protein BDZ88DRAFT_427501 [Geranomyces variabilis]KAJ3132406.1 hypothetical protein HDU90_006920 [Geranomyces variabilis]
MFAAKLALLSAAAVAVAAQDMSAPAAMPALPTDIPTPAMPTPTASAANAAPSAAAGNCSQFQQSFVTMLDTCVQTGIDNAGIITMQAQADAAFLAIAKCSCAGMLPLESNFLNFEESCPDPATGKPQTAEEKATGAQTFALCKAGDYAGAAASMHLYINMGGQKWTPSATISSAIPSASTSVSAAKPSAAVATPAPSSVVTPAPSTSVSSPAAAAGGANSAASTAFSSSVVVGVAGLLVAGLSFF